MTQTAEMTTDKDMTLLEGIEKMVGSVLSGSKRCEISVSDNINVVAYRCGTVLRIDVKGLETLK